MAEEPKIKSELEQIPYEPLVPVQTSLIRLSLGLGVVLMIVLVWMTYAFFPPGG